MYDLTAIVVHNGTTATSGHYFMLRETSDGWFKFNDSIVTQVTDKELNHFCQESDEEDTPYILLYRKTHVTSPPKRYAHLFGNHNKVFT